MHQFNERSDWNQANDGPTALYRLYRNNDQLLYVGISNNPDKRWRFHAADKPWWHWVARRDVVWLGSRREALEAEEKATVEEKPRFGDTARLGKGWRTTPRSDSDPEIQREARQVEDRLRQRITTGEYAIGDRLVRQKLAAQYGVCRALVGMALLELERDGLTKPLDLRASVVMSRSFSGSTFSRRPSKQQ